jgi:hypothetical protein
VQRLPREAEGFSPASIQRISDNRISKVREVHPNLMRASCEEPGLDQCKTSESLNDPVARHGLSPVGAYSHLCAASRMSADARSDRPFELLDIAVDECHVSTVHSSSCHLRLQHILRLGGLRHHERAGRVFVQPVHDSRAVRIIAELRDSRQYRVGQRPSCATSPRMHGETGWFVDHHERAVFIQDIKRDWLRFHLPPGLRGDLDLYALPAPDRRRRFRARAIQAHAAGSNQRFDARP